MFFILLIVKSFEILPKHSAYYFISGSFDLSWYIFVALTNKKLLIPLQCRLSANLLFGSVKLIRYIGSAFNVVSSNPCIGPSGRIKISFPLLSICTDGLISGPKIMTLFPIIPSLNKNSERESNPTP